MIADRNNKRVDDKEVNRVMALLHNVEGISYEDICYSLMDFIGTDDTASALVNLMDENDISAHETFGWDED